MEKNVMMATTWMRMDAKETARNQFVVMVYLMQGKNVMMGIVTRLIYVGTVNHQDVVTRWWMMVKSVMMVTLMRRMGAETASCQPAGME